MLTVLLLAQIAGAPLQVVNAAVERRQLERPLAAEIPALLANRGPAWIGYQVPIARGWHQACVSDGRPQSPVLLEPPDRLSILIRVEDGSVGQLRTVTPDCSVDGGGLPFIWLDGVTSSDSAAWLSTLIAARPAAYPLPDRIVQTAIGALAFHAEPPALDRVIRLARDDRRAAVRASALFWLSMRAGEQAVAAIASAVDADPEIEVKKKAVFALSRLPKQEGVPLLIQIARSNPHREVRKQAMFWLGQSNDPRALAFFEEVLTRR